VSGFLLKFLTICKGCGGDLDVTVNSKQILEVEPCQRCSEIHEQRGRMFARAEAEQKAGAPQCLTKS
jgi:hypothetical protein